MHRSKNVTRGTSVKQMRGMRRGTVMTMSQILRSVTDIKRSHVKSGSLVLDVDRYVDDGGFEWWPRSRCARSTNVFPLYFLLVLFNRKQASLKKIWWWCLWDYLFGAFIWSTWYVDHCGHASSVQKTSAVKSGRDHSRQHLHAKTGRWSGPEWRAFAFISCQSRLLLKGAKGWC